MNLLNGTVQVRSGFLVDNDGVGSRDGDRLKIKVPSIVFRPDFDDFKNSSEAAANTREYTTIKPEDLKSAENIDLNAIESWLANLK